MPAGSARMSYVSVLALMGCPALAACSGYDEPLPPQAGIVVQDVAPPAISGGTLLVTKGLRPGLAVAADPDRDAVWIVDLQKRALQASVALEEGSEPGRVVEDASGHVHVALRRGGGIVTIDLTTGKAVASRNVCPAPRGLAYDEATDDLHVACAGGELVTLPAAGGAPSRVLHLDDDLRDVVVDGDRLLVSRFRAADVLVLDHDGSVVRRRRPVDFIPLGNTSQQFQAGVAWRMIGLPGGGVAISHQREMTTPIVITAPAYYSAAGCDPSIVHSTVTVMRDAALDVPLTTPGAAATVPFAVLPVDVAVSGDGTKVALVAAGSNLVYESGSLAAVEAEVGWGDCTQAMQPLPTDGQPIGAAFDGPTLVLQTREPAAIVLRNPGGADQVIKVSDMSRYDTGHDMFHRSPNSATPTSVACASCHPEGRDDGQTWSFDPVGLRRTQSIGGGVLQTAPLHWDGDLKDMDSFMGEVFVRRMNGQKPGPRKLEAFAGWVDALPVVPASEPVDPDAVARGDALFHDETVACASCHGGARYTNDENKDVGTGKAFQVPSLVGIAHRAPYMHDGCAATLEDRFGPCGGGDKHGHTSQLSAAQIDDLVAYLRQL